MFFVVLLYFYRVFCVFCVFLLMLFLMSGSLIIHSSAPFLHDAFSQGIENRKNCKKAKKLDFTCSCFRQILRDKTHVKSDDEGIDAVIIIINLLFDIVVVVAIVSPCFIFEREKKKKKECYHHSSFASSK